MIKWKKNRGYLVLLIFILNSLSGCNKDASVYRSAIDSTRHFIESIKTEYMVPGICACISVKGKIIWCEGFGYANLEDKVPVNPKETLFRIGSVSKTFTAEALAILYEQGKLNWDDPIQQYVSYFPEKKYPITVRQVAGHIAGIRHYIGDENLSNINYASVKDGLSIFKDDPLLFEPGTRYKYSSYGWNLLSAVVEGASGEEFLSYMDSNVFKPLGMKTQADINSKVIPERTTFYERKNNRPILAPKVDNSYKWAGGGFLSTCEDLILFGNAHLYPKLISEETFNLLVERQIINDTLKTDYGMGWINRENEDNITFYGHSGGSIGGVTMLAVYPESETVVSLVSNSSNVTFKDVFHKMEKWFNEKN